MAAVNESTKRVAQIINVVLTYWVISISMVFFNKSLVGGHKSDGEEEVDISIYIAWSQCVVCVIFVLLYTKIGSKFSEAVQVSIFSQLVH